MKAALLVAWENTRTNEEGYEWQNNKEQTISKSFETVTEAFDNKPVGYDRYIQI